MNNDDLKNNIINVDKIAGKIDAYEQRKVRKQNKKQEKKDKKKQATEARLQARDHQTRTLLENASFADMTTQQKIWVAIKLTIYAGTPFFIYMIMPAVVIAVGTALFSHSIKNIGEAYSMTASNFYTFIGIICSLIYLFRSARRRGSSVSKDITFSIKGVNWKYIGLMALFGFCASVCISALYTLLPDSLMQTYDSYTSDAYNSYDIVLVMLSLAVIDPIAEEIVFRGYMLNRLLPSLKEKASIWIVTALFALCHLSIWWMLYGLLLGWVLAKISIRHDNIMYSIAIHMGFNLPSVINYLIMQNEGLNEFLFGSKFTIAFYAVLFGVAAYALVLYYNRAENLGLNLKFWKRK